MRTQYNELAIYADDFMQYIVNGIVVFDERDNKRDWELFVLSGYILAEQKPERIAICGGGDGIAASVAVRCFNDVAIVDIDPDVLDLAENNPDMVRINDGVLKQVKKYAKDAEQWLQKCRTGKYDVIILDYPLPTSKHLQRLWSHEHYSEAKRSLRKGGVLFVHTGFMFNWKLMAYVSTQLRKLFKYVVPLKCLVHNGIACGVIACDTPKLDFDRLKDVETSAFDKAMFAEASSYGKDFRRLLKENIEEVEECLTM